MAYEGGNQVYTTPVKVQANAAAPPAGANVVYVNQYGQPVAPPQQTIYVNQYGQPYVNINICMVILKH